MKNLYQVRFTTLEQRLDGSRVVFSDFYNDYNEARKHFENASKAKRFFKVEFIV